MPLVFSNDDIDHKSFEARSLASVKVLPYFEPLRNIYINIKIKK